VVYGRRPADRESSRHSKWCRKNEDPAACFNLGVNARLARMSRAVHMYIICIRVSNASSVRGRWFTATPVEIMEGGVTHVQNEGKLYVHVSRRNFVRVVTKERWVSVRNVLCEQLSDIIH
jgi:hypothetical protein